MAKILELNLIKTKIKVIETRRYFTRISRIIYFLALLIFAGISYDFYVINGKISTAKKEIAKLESSIVEKRKNFNLEEMEREWGVYCGKLRVVSALAGARTSVGAKLKTCANLLPPNMCISKVEAVGDKNSKKKFTIDLMSLPNEQRGFKDVESFISSLETSVFVGKGVKLESHERTLINKNDIELFRISFPENEGVKQ